MEGRQASFNRERRFSSDIAHELRTPLAELQSIAEVEIEWGEPAHKNSYREVLGISLDMNRVVEQLLALKVRLSGSTHSVSAKPVEPALPGC